MNNNDSAIRTYPSSVRRLAGAARRACILAAGLMLALPAMAQTTRYVNPLHPDSQDGVNTCADPGIPCETIGHAVDVALGGDVIDIAGAIYTETIQIDKSLSLHGAGQGVTIIQAHAQAGQATSSVITIGGSFEVEIVGLTIRHGVGIVGGGMAIAGSGIAIASTVTLTDVTFSDNFAELSGGGLFIAEGSNITLTNVVFSGNEAVLTGGGGGGGMEHAGDMATLTGVTFTNNHSSSSGGGMRILNNATLTDVTFTGNQAVVGGGLYSYSGQQTLTNLTFDGNEAGEDGGGMYILFGTPTLSDVAFSGNTAAHGGGGMYIGGNSAGVELAEVTFTDNSADEGGGMYNRNNSTSLTQVSFDGNEAAGTGGGMYHAGAGSPTFVNVTFTENHALAGGGLHHDGTGSPELTHVSFFGNTAVATGGGMLSGGGAPVLTDLAFIGNEAGTSGGGMDNQSSSPVLANVTFTGNLADQHGGGMNNINSSAVLTNAVFIDNRAGETGGAVRNAVSSSLAITNAAFSGNVALVDGGAIRNLNSSPALSNAIVWNNEANGSATSASASISNEGTAAPTLGYSLIANSGGSGGWDPDIGVDQGNNIDTDPLFVVTPDPGDIPNVNANLRLTEASPAIDAGDPGTDPLSFPTGGEGEPIDGDGSPRFFNTLIDMGPYEWQPLVDAIFSDRFESQ